MTAVINRSVAAGQHRAVRKHIPALRHVIHVPLARNDDCFEHLAVCKHTCRAFNFRCIKARKIQLFELLAEAEHCKHICHIGGIPAGEIHFFQFCAVHEHSLHDLRPGGVPAGKIQRFQTAATIKHQLHFLHRGCIQSGQIQCLQRDAVHKHRNHILHGGSIQSCQVHLSQLIASVEHIVHIRNLCSTCIGKVNRLRLETVKQLSAVHRKNGVLLADNLFDRGFICIGLNLCRDDVAAERQHAGFLIQLCAGPDIRARCREIARRIRSINVCVLRIDMRICVGGTVSADKRAVKGEHLIGFLDILRCPAVGDKDRFQIKIAPEHPVHVGDLRCIECGEIKLPHHRAACEHMGHIRHIRGIQTGEVCNCERFAAVKHMRHICHFGCIHAAEIHRKQILAAIEHACAASLKFDTCRREQHPFQIAESVFI